MLFARIPKEHHSRTHTIVRSFLDLANYGKVPANTPEGHKDGWGYAQYVGGELVRMYRSPEHPFVGEQVEHEIAAIGESEDMTLLTHVRKASVGDIKEENCHPFISGKWAMIHNGSLGTADQDVFREVAHFAQGDTDTERYFHLLVQAFASSHDEKHVISGIQAIVALLRNETSYKGKGYSSASMMLTDGERAYIMLEYDHEHPIQSEHGNMGEYFTLFVGETGEQEIEKRCLIVSSEQLFIDGVNWQPVLNHQILIINLFSGERKIVSV